MRFRRPSEIKFIERVLLREIATGLSSHALALYALGLNDDMKPRGPYMEYPRDWGDFGRCVETYNAAPKHLKRKMLPLMNLWYADLSEVGGVPSGRVVESMMEELLNGEG